MFILDKWLSGYDGRKLCRRLKTDKKTKNLPVLMLSASSDIENLVIPSEADGVIEKPFDTKELLGTVKKFME